jgi:hypothetical protein
MGECQWHYTPYLWALSYYNQGNLDKLTRHPVQCPEKELLQAFHLQQKAPGDGFVRYAFKCCKSSNFVPFCSEARTPSTTWATYDFSELIQHPIDCSNDEFLNGFHLLAVTTPSSGNDLSMKYTCCKQTIVNQCSRHGAHCVSPGDKRPYMLHFSPLPKNQPILYTCTHINVPHVTHHPLYSVILLTDPFEECSAFQTGYNSMAGAGHSVPSLAVMKVLCPLNTFLQKFSMESLNGQGVDSHVYLKYNYRCCILPSASPCALPYREQLQATNFFSHEYLQATENSFHIRNVLMECRHGVISEFFLELHPHGGGRSRYMFRCCPSTPEQAFTCGDQQITQAPLYTQGMVPVMASMSVDCGDGYIGDLELVGPDRIVGGVAINWQYHAYIHRCCQAYQPGQSCNVSHDRFQS